MLLRYILIVNLAGCASNIDDIVNALSISRKLNWKTENWSITIISFGWNFCNLNLFKDSFHEIFDNQFRNLVQ